MSWWKKNKSSKDPSQSSKDDQKANHFTHDSHVNWIFYSLLFTMVIIAAAGFRMFREAYLYELKYAEYEDQWLEQRNKLHSEISPVDSILTGIIPINDKEKANDKKVIKQSQSSNIKANKYLVPLSDVIKITETQKLILSRQDQLTDDIRQETNNIINKMNGWLGFWMAVMAILGVFVPIALQIKLYRETRDNDDRLRQEYKNELKILREEASTYEQKCESATRNEQAKIQSELLSIDIEINKQFEELRANYRKDIDDIKRIKFAVSIRSFHSIVDSPEIRTLDLRNKLLENNWREIVDQVEVFINHYTQDNIPKEEPYIMSVILVQVASVITSLRIINPHRKRQFEALATETFEILKEMNTIPVNLHTLVARLRNYRYSLDNLNPIMG